MENTNTTTKQVPIYKQIEQACEEICDNYCRFHGDDMTDEEYDELYEEHCVNCPLVRLL